MLNAILYYGSLAFCFYLLISAWVYALSEEETETTENE